MEEQLNEVNEKEMCLALVMDIDDVSNYTHYIWFSRMSKIKQNVHELKREFPFS